MPASRRRIRLRQRRYRFQRHGGMPNGKQPKGRRVHRHRARPNIAGSTRRRDGVRQAWVVGRVDPAYRHSGHGACANARARRPDQGRFAAPLARPQWRYQHRRGFALGAGAPRPVLGNHRRACGLGGVLRHSAQPIAIAQAGRSRPDG